MKTSIFYFTGTGNSLWAARRIAAASGGAGLLSLNAGRRIEDAAGSEAVGLVFPVHIWGLPRRIAAFAGSLPLNDRRYYFAAAANAGQPAGTLLQLERLMAVRGIRLSRGFSLELPSNYIPWGGAEPADRQAARLAAAGAKIMSEGPRIAARERAPVERGPLWQRLLLSGLAYRLSLPKVAAMDAKFSSDGKCTACGLCARVCPAGDIELRGGRPAWLGRCEQCMACIQFCPAAAIQYGKGTAGRARYHNPEVSAADLAA